MRVPPASLPRRAPGQGPRRPSGAGLLPLHLAAPRPHLLAFFSWLSACAADAAAPGLVWQPLAPGIDFAEARLAVASPVGDSTARIVRVDPALARLELHAAALEGGRPLPPSAWMDRTHGIAAINAGMFGGDYLSAVGHLVVDGKVVTAGWAPSNNSLFATGAVSAEDPAFHLYDLACTPRDAAVARYRSVIQSIRMLGCSGENVWADAPKTWSAAVVGADSAGRAYLIHVRSPYRMHALVDQLVALPLGLRALHYGEGGPEAFLAVHAPTLTHTWTGSWETGFHEADDADATGDLPNVLVALPR